MRAASLHLAVFSARLHETQQASAKVKPFLNFLLRQQPAAACLQLLYLSLQAAWVITAIAVAAEKSLSSIK